MGCFNRTNGAQTKSECFKRVNGVDPFPSGGGGNVPIEAYLYNFAYNTSTNGAEHIGSKNALWSGNIANGISQFRAPETGTADIVVALLTQSDSKTYEIELFINGTTTSLTESNAMTPDTVATFTFAGQNLTENDDIELLLDNTTGSGGQRNIAGIVAITYT